MVFENFVESQSNGAIEVRCTPVTIVWQFRQCLEAVRLNCEITGTAALPMCSRKSSHGPAHVQNDRVPAVMHRNHTKAQSSLKRHFGLMGLNNTGRDFFTKDVTIKTPNLKGVKMDHQSPLQVEMVKLMGGNPCRS